MSQIVNSDFFIFIAGMADILIAVFLVIILALFIKIVNDVRQTVQTVKEEIDELTDDLNEVREDAKKRAKTAMAYLEVAAGSLTLRKVLGTLGNFITKRTSNTKRNKKSK